MKYRKDVWVGLLVEGLREKIEAVRGSLTYAEVVGVLELVKAEVVAEAEEVSDGDEPNACNLRGILQNDISSALDDCAELEMSAAQTRDVVKTIIDKALQA